MKKNIIIILSSLLLFECNTSEKKQKNTISKICFATGGCYGHCPFLAIEIDSSLNYKFHGTKYTEKNGYFIGKVSQSFWDTLNKKFENINYKMLDSSYNHSVDDLSTETIIYYDNNRKHILGKSSSLPDSVLKVFVWVMDSYKNVKLKKSSPNLLQFETKIQHPLPPIVLPFQNYPPPK